MEPPDLKLTKKELKKLIEAMEGMDEIYCKFINIMCNSHDIHRKFAGKMRVAYSLFNDMKKKVEENDKEV